MLVIVIILFIVGLLFVILVLWYTLYCVGRHKNKVEEDEESSLLLAEGRYGDRVKYLSAST